MGHNRQKSNRRIVDEDQDQLSFVFDTLTDAIFTVEVEQNDTFRFVSANQQFLKNMGLSRNDVIGATLEDIIPETSVEFVRSKYKESIEKDESLRWEESIELNSEIKTGMVSVTPVYNKSRECLQLIGSISDITDRKAAEDELRKVMDQSLDVICTIDGQGLFIKVSDAAQRLWHYTPEELQGEPFMELVHPDDRASTAAIAEQIMDGLEITNFENRYIRKDGSEIPMIWSARWDDEDKLMYCVGKDAGELKEAKSQLQLREERFRKLVQEGGDMIAILSSEGNYRYVSPSHKQVLGYEKDELIGKQAIDMVIHPEDKEKVKEYFSTLLQEKKITTTVYRARTKSGDVVRLKSTGTNLLDHPAVEGIVVNSSDVTESYYYNNLDKLERKILQDNLSGVDLKSLLKNFVEGIEEIHDGVICSIMSIDDGKLHNLVSPNLPSEYIHDIEGLQIGSDAGSCGTAAYLGEKVIVSNTQLDPRWERYRNLADQFGFSSCWSYPICNTDDEVIATFAVYHTKCKEPSEFEENTLERGTHLVQTILENQKMLKALHESNERYELATRATSEAIWEYKPGTDEYMMGEGFVSLFGYERQSSTYGINYWIDKIHPDDRQTLKAEVEKMITGEENRLEAEYRLQKANGTYAYVRDKAIVVRDKNGRAERVVGAMQDITSKKREELQLKLMESVVTNTRDSILITRAEPMDGPDGPEILYVNDSFEEMTGYSAGEVIGKTPRILQGPNTDFEALKDLGEKIRRWESATVETINYKKNGEEFWINFSVTPVADETGWYTHWIAVERDVTERKNRELKQTLLTDIGQVFNESEGLIGALEKTLNNIQVFGDFELVEYWMVNQDENCIERMASVSNQDFSAFYNHEDNRESFVYGEGLPGCAWKTGERQFWKNLHKRSSFIRREAAKKVGLRTGYGFPVRFNGEVTGVILAALKETPDKPHYFAPILDDVARQLGQEMSRKKLEEELSRIFEAAPDGIILAGFDGYLKKVNPAFCEMLGYSEKVLTETPFINFLHPDDIERTIEMYEKANTGSDVTYFENRYVTKSGRVVWLAWTFKVFPEERVTFSVAKNITDKKELEQLLDKSNRMARIGSWEVDLVNDKIYWTDVTREIHETGPDYEPDLGEAISFYKEGEHREKIRKVVDQAIENGTQWDLELQIVTAKGNERWVRAIGEAEFVNGDCTRLYGSFQDIHDRKTAEENLKVKTRHIEAISKLNSALLNYQDWYNALSDHLEVIGKAVESDRVYYFENRYDPETGEGYTTQKLEWCREGITPQQGNPEVIDVPFPEVPELINPMLDRNPSSALLSEIGDESATRHVMENQGIKAFLAIPVYVENRFHGFVGFDNCTTERYWSEEERTTLETITANLATAISRQHLDEQLKEVLDEKNTILESISDAFYAVDDDWTITYFNSEAENLLIKKWENVIGKNIWDEFPAAKSTEIYDIYHDVMMRKEPQAFEYYYPPLDSWFDISANPAENGISVYFKNIDERKREQRIIEQKTRQLDAIAKFNSLLIKEEEWRVALKQSLPVFAEVLNSERVYYFRNEENEQTGEQMAKIDLWWSGLETEDEISHPAGQAIPFSQLEEFLKPLSENRVYKEHIDNISDEFFRKQLKEEDIKSILAVPVFTSSGFHGVIGFDDCTDLREWSEEEISFIQTISINLSSAIENEQADVALQLAYNEKNEILESIGDAFFAVDDEWTVTYWNNMAEKFLGMPKEKIVGQHLWDIYEDAVELDFYSQYHRAVREQVTVHFEEYYPGTGNWFEVSAYPSESGLSIFFKDVTERKQDEKRLNELNQSLEEKTKALERSNAELEQFAFVASHDLQEPLRMISGFLAQLEKKYNDVLDEKGKKYIYFATDGAKRMRQIILDLLEFSRVGRVDTEKEQVDLNEVVSDVLSLNKSLIAETNATIDCEELPVVRASVGAMRQLFLNLINNALKYHEEGSKPVVSIHSEEAETYWRFEITDNGIGINPEYSEKIFNIFQRLHGKEEYGGSGVGLTICKKIIEEHGGTIGVNSEEGEGSTFYFTIPK